MVNFQTSRESSDGEIEAGAKELNSPSFKNFPKTVHSDSNQASSFSNPDGSNLSLSANGECLGDDFDCEMPFDFIYPSDFVLKLKCVHEVLVLDCREPQAFELSHIDAAINVHLPDSCLCEPFSCRDIEHSILKSYADKMFFRLKDINEVYLYGHGSGKDGVESCVWKVHNALTREGKVKSLHILEGGFSSFAARFPRFVHTSNPPTPTSVSPAYLQPSAVECGDSAEDQMGAGETLPADHSVASVTKRQKIARGRGALAVEPEPALQQDACSQFPTLEERLKIAHQRLFRSLTMQFKCELPTNITDRLYLGSAQNGANRRQLRELGIGWILNCTRECKNHFPGEFHYLQRDIVDHESEDILNLHFEPCFEFLDRALQSSACVLVHCFVGMSRSATVVIAYLMRKNGWDLRTAFSFVRQRRPIEPNPGFMQKLVEFEEMLLSHRPTSPSPIDA